jgi:hypothetical protein
MANTKDEAYSVAVLPRWQNRLWWGFCVLLAAPVLIAFFYPGSLDRHGIGGNEAATVGTLKKLNGLENQRKAGGFLCDFKALGYKPSIQSEGLLGSDGLKRSGYLFELRDCSPDTTGAGRYAITASPEYPKRTGVRAFCSDQSGVVYFDNTGSAEACLAIKKPLN